jgi:hypothetical protein
MDIKAITINILYYLITEMVICHYRATKTELINGFYETISLNVPSMDYLCPSIINRTTN